MRFGSPATVRQEGPQPASEKICFTILDVSGLTAALTKTFHCLYQLTAPQKHRARRLNALTAPLSFPELHSPKCACGPRKNTSVLSDRPHSNKNQADRGRTIRPRAERGAAAAEPELGGYRAPLKLHTQRRRRRKEWRNRAKGIFKGRVRARSGARAKSLQVLRLTSRVTPARLHSTSLRLVTAERGLL